MRSNCQVIGDILFVFHGRRTREELAPISVLDLTSWNWTTLRPRGIPPHYPLIYFSSWAYQDRMYIFGGMALSKDFNGHHLRNDLFYYDTSTTRWEWPFVSGILKMAPFTDPLMNCIITPEEKSINSISYILCNQPVSRFLFVM